MEEQAVAIGFDIGTTLSVAAAVDSSGQLRVLSNAKGDYLVPSAVYFADRVLVGEDAILASMGDPNGLAVDFKRDVGKPHYHQELRHCQVPPEVLTAFLLEHMQEHARATVGVVSSAVLTVPAFFDEKRRTAMQHAARLAGLQVVDIINEPTAAAIAASHGALGQRNEGHCHRLLVYDLGGGTFDVTIIEMVGRVVRALATDGDVLLGGRDFDERLSEVLSQKFMDRFGVDPRATRTGLQRLWRETQQAKHSLSQSETCTVEMRHADLRANFQLRRDEFESVIEPLVERTLATTTEVLQQANLQWEDLDHVLLVGGSSKIPMIARRMRELSGVPTQLAENPEQLVAMGAALYAATLGDAEFLDQDSRFEVLNVNSHSLGVQGVDVATGKKINKILIPRNSTLPATKTRRFVTHQDGQRNVKIRLLEGESDNPDFCSILGNCRVNFPPQPKGSAVDVTCRYEADGTVTVSGRVPDTRSSAEARLQREGRNVLEPLEVWRARLTTGGEVPHVVVRSEQIASDQNSPVLPYEQSLMAMDQLCRIVGESAISGAVPTSALPTQRLLRDLDEECRALRVLIRRLQQRLANHQKKAGRFQERIEITGQIALAKMAWDQSSKLKQHCEISLGRACLANNLISNTVADVTEEYQSLAQQLDQPIDD